MRKVAGKCLFCAVFLTLLPQFTSTDLVASESSVDGHRFRVGARAGYIRFTGHRAFNKYSDELLGKDNPSGMVVWPNILLDFNESKLLRPVFSIRFGLVYFYGEESRSYQSTKLTVKTEGALFESGFRIGFYPGLSWLFLYHEIGLALPLTETVTFEAPTGKKSFHDEQRWIANILSFAARIDLPLSFYTEAVFSTSLIDGTDDDMYTLGVGYGF